MVENALDRARMLQQRSKQFALRIIKLFRSLPKTPEAQIMGKQLLRAATSVAANYRAACRARSRSEFSAKMGVVVEEADETVLWLELLVESDVMPIHRMAEILKEAQELLAIFSASRQTTRETRR